MLPINTVHLEKDAAPLLDLDSALDLSDLRSGRTLAYVDHSGWRGLDVVRSAGVPKPYVSKLGGVAGLTDVAFSCTDGHFTSEAVEGVELSRLWCTGSARSIVVALGRLAHRLQMPDLAASATLLSLLWTLGLDMSSLPAAVADHLAFAFVVGAATFLAVTSTRAVIVAASTAAAAATGAAATSSRKLIALAISP